MKTIFMPTVAGVLLIFCAIPQIAEAVDTVPPEAECMMTCDGSGFFLISATDDVASGDDIQLFITDTGTGTVFGAFSSPDVIRYIQSGRTPTMVPKNGSFWIFGSGTPNLSAVDPSGNVSNPVACEP